ncbi:MAG: AAA family ATPase [Proteobacteria bacterium]|nr:AAA family ATPase [Pseudomonadota bacterium]
MNAMMRPHEPEAARDAVHRLFAGALSAGFKLAGLHRYNTSDGAELLRVVRLKHPGWADLADAERDALRQRHQCDGKGKIVRQMHRDGTHYVAKAPARPAHGWPLYRPPYPLVDTLPVIYVEGEACADALAKLGLPAVASLGGAGQADHSDWRGEAHTALLWPDNDKPGTNHMTAVAAKLHAIGCTVELVDVDRLNLPAKGDCVDWLAAHPNATAADVLALPRIAPAEPVDVMPRVILTRGDAVQPVAVDWLWPGWLAAGKLHLIGGAPGTGKTTIAAALAACVTCGGRWPDGTRAQRGSVVFWSGEDDVADTLNPRLRAAGADMAHVHMVEGVKEGADRYPFDPACDMDALRLALVAIPDVRLIVIDPIVSAVSGDSHKNAEVRRGLQPLVDLAGQLRCALLGVTHFSKGTSGRDPVERITGSLAFGALARLVMVTAKQEAKDEQPERRVMLRAKSNIGPDGGGFVYDLQQGALPGYEGIEASSVLWGEAIHGTARELLAEAEQVDDDGGEGRDAVRWLHELLKAGPVQVKDVKRHGENEGFAWRTLQRAMRRAGVTSQRAGFGMPATWSLADSGATVAPFAPLSECGANGANGEEVARLDGDGEAFDL